tara:strand:+ start:34 stop:537 length:504 start_codon:yes stop_codon:yes gene_type:complete
MRTKIHGTFETGNLFRFDSADPIIMDRGTILTGDTPNEIYTKFEAIDTLKLIRAMTHKASASSLAAGAALVIVPGTHDDNGAGTVWRVVVYWHHGTSNPNFQLWHCFATTAGIMNEVKDSEVLSSGAGGTLDWTSSDSGGLQWTNNHASANAFVRASALKIQSTSDF